MRPSSLGIPGTGKQGENARRRRIFLIHLLDIGDPGFGKGTVEVKTIDLSMPITFLFVYNALSIKFRRF